MITNKQKFSLIYFITNSFFLASGYSLIFKVSGKDSWLSMILGTLIGTFFIYLMNKYIFNKNSNNILTKLITYSFHLFIIFVNILVVRIFATSFFLTKTPGIVITLPFISLAFMCSKKGINTIVKMSELLLPISLFFITISMLAVLKDGSINSFLPLLTVPKSKIFISSLYYGIFTAIPHLMLYNINIDEKIHIKSYIYSSLISIFIGVIIISTLGPYLIKVFRFPEYMVLKQIKLFNFIEKIENLIGLVWFFDLFMSSSVCFYNLNKVINKNFIIAIIIASIVCFVEFVSKNYEYANYIYKHLPILLFIIGFIFFIIFYRNKKSS